MLTCLLNCLTKSQQIAFAWITFAVETGLGLAAEVDGVVDDVG